MSVSVIVMICICSACILGLIFGWIGKATEHWYGALICTLICSIIFWFYASISYSNETHQIYPKIRHNKTNYQVTAIYQYDGKDYEDGVNIKYDKLTNDIQWYIVFDKNLFGHKKDIKVTFQQKSDYEYKNYSNIKEEKDLLRSINNIKEEKDTVKITDKKNIIKIN